MGKRNGTLIRCLTCGYPLERLDADARRCPECGRSFDLDDPSTFAAPLPVRPSGGRAMAGMLIVAASAVGLPFSCMLAGEAVLLPVFGFMIGLLLLYPSRR